MTDPLALQVTGPAALVGYGGGLLVVAYATWRLIDDELRGPQRGRAGGRGGPGSAAGHTDPDAESVHARIPTPGDDLRPIDQYRYRYREILRQQVHLRLVNEFHRSPEAADRIIADGDWTDDEVAAAFVGESAGSRGRRGLLSRLRDRLSGRRRDRDRDAIRIERAIAALETLDETGELPPSATETPRGDESQGDAAGVTDGGRESTDV